MGQDIRELLKKDVTPTEKMSKNHEAHFLDKLNMAFPEKKQPKFVWLRIAASIILLMGLSFGAYNYFLPKVEISKEVATTDTVEAKTLGDVSPGLKKVEDYYLASINLELSKMKPTVETKDLFDGYLEQFEGLNKEYERLSAELTTVGPNELMINALIDNLKMRLNLLYRLREQVSSLNSSEDNSSKSI